MCLYFQSLTQRLKESVQSELEGANDMAGLGGVDMDGQSVIRNLQERLSMALQVSLLFFWSEDQFQKYFYSLDCSVWTFELRCLKRFKHCSVWTVLTAVFETFELHNYSHQRWLSVSYNYCLKHATYWHMCILTYLLTSKKTNWN